LFLLVLRLPAGIDLSWFGRLCFGAVINLPGVGVAIAKAQRPRTFVVGSSTSTPPQIDSYHLIERSDTSASIKWYQISG